VKFLINRDGSKTSTTIHDPLGLKYQPLEKTTTTVDCLENQFTSHDLCEESHKRRVDVRVQALIEAADDTPLEKVRPCDIQKLIKSLKLRKASGIESKKIKRFDYQERSAYMSFSFPAFRTE
jgi:hypothetical protein